MLLFATFSFGQAPIYQFKFQSADATIGTGTFSYTAVFGNPQAAVGPDTDRSRVAGKALNFRYHDAGAVLTGLPTGNASRTISCWVFHRANETFAPFFYGNSSNGQAFSLTIIPSTNQISFNGFGGAAFDKFFSQVTVLNTWTHYAVTYNGTAVKIYVNGQLKLTSNVSLNTANSNFKIGVNAANNLSTANVKYDELNIFSSALTDAQIQTLFKQNDSQTALQPNIPTTGLVYANHFTNGNTSDSSTTGAVVNNIAGTPTADSFGQANNALSLTQGLFVDYEVINYPELYVGALQSNNFEFSVSIQVKVDPTYYANLALNDYVTLLNHGGIYLRIFKTTGGAVLQGGYQQPNGIFANGQSLALSDPQFTTNFLTATMTNSVNGNAVRLYVNNNTVSGGSGTTSQGVNYNAFPKLTFGLQSGVPSQSFRGTIDNVYIYNRALTSTEVAAIVNSNTLSNSSFQVSNLKVKMYPNPAQDILNIDVDSYLKLVEIYSLLGKKVLSVNEKQVDISNLSNGIYMVRVEDVDGAVATQKLVKE